MECEALAREYVKHGLDQKATGAENCADMIRRPMALKVGSLVRFRGRDYTISARGDKPGTWDLWPAADGADHWRGVPTRELHPFQ